MTDLDEMIRRGLREITDPVADVDRVGLAELLATADSADASADASAADAEAADAEAADAPTGATGRPRRWIVASVTAAAAVVTLIGVLILGPGSDDVERVVTDAGPSTTSTTRPTTDATGVPASSVPATSMLTPTTQAPSPGVAPAATTPTVGPHGAPTTAVPTPGAPATIRASDAPPGSLRVRIDVARSLRAGSSVDGTITLDNGSGRPVTAEGCSVPYWTNLRIGTVTIPGVQPMCLETFTFPAGESRWPIRISGSWGMCTNSPTPDTTTPACDPATGSPPPLDPGTYTVTVSGAPGLPVPPELTVEITP